MKCTVVRLTSAHVLRVPNDRSLEYTLRVGCPNEGCPRTWYGVAHCVLLCDCGVIFEIGTGKVFGGTLEPEWTGL